MKALGMESGAIANSEIIASSEWDVKHSPKQARLHIKETANGRGAWVSLTDDLNQWLQVDLRKITPVTHVATQGRNSWSPVQMVTKYKLQFSDDGASFLFYKRQGESSDAVNVLEILLPDILFTNCKTNENCATYHMPCSRGPSEFGQTLKDTARNFFQFI